jgi:hypothetical protein
MADARIHITQQSPEEVCYTRLQQTTLDELQRLSGKVWTDFNTHDPGVTIADIANYALSELDYKLGFGWQDYLTGEHEPFQPERFGLFPASEVFSPSIVTTDDYLALLAAEFPTLLRICMQCDPSTGRYRIEAMPSPFERHAPDLPDRIRSFFHQHRNLCETPGEVLIRPGTPLVLHADIEIGNGEDADVVLANLYAVTIRGLAGQIATEAKLYEQLRRIEGVSFVRSCYLTDEATIVSVFTDNDYTLLLPEQADEIKVRITSCGSVLSVRYHRFVELLHARYFLRDTPAAVSYPPFVASGTYRNLYGHRPVAADFPRCYDTGDAAFAAYLHLFDTLITNGLQELGELPHLLSIASDTPINTRRIADKHRYLDLLDRLYGVESNPAWLKELDYYGETDYERLTRRMTFLRHVPRLTRERFRSRNLMEKPSYHNIPVIKAHLSYLLRMNADERMPISNVLPSHNLLLTGDAPGYPGLRRRTSAFTLVNEDDLYDDERYTVERLEVTSDVANQWRCYTSAERTRRYRRMLQELSVFNNSLISGGLFRGGVTPSNYHIIGNGSDYRLTLHNVEERVWMNLGRADSRAHIIELGITLRYYLRELNLQSEAFYVVEHNLLYEPEYFHVSFVFPCWTARCHSPRFREVCCRQIRQLLPAHITAGIYWLEPWEMQTFEDNYHKWCNSLRRSVGKIYSARITEVLKRAKEKTTV